MTMIMMMVMMLLQMVMLPTMVAIAMVQNMTISSFQCIKAFGFAWKTRVDTVTYSDKIQLKEIMN